MPEKTSPAKPVRATARASNRPKAATPTTKPVEPKANEGDRIAKVLSRAGVASRREAERMIEAGEVRVNGKLVTSPALNVTAKDKITVSGHVVGAPEPARMWLYYKPNGLVTSSSDEKGRETVFDYLPEDMPRVMTVGRLDLNSEGLLLLTNDGELKRRLELPSTGWLRKYRVRVNGNPTDPELEPLRKGMVIDGERFQPMEVILDRHQGSNAWLTVGLREGRNREIRRTMAEIGISVNRLIRISYGPFRLGDLQPGEVSEVRPKILREQLGPLMPDAPEVMRESSRHTTRDGLHNRDDAAPRRGLRTSGKTGGDVGRRASAEGPGYVSTPQGRAALKDLSNSWGRATSARRANEIPDDGNTRPLRTSREGLSTERPWYGPRDNDTAPSAKPSAPKPAAKPAAKPYEGDRPARGYDKPGENKPYGKSFGKADGKPSGAKPGAGKSFAAKPAAKSARPASTRNSPKPAPRGKK